MTTRTSEHGGLRRLVGQPAVLNGATLRGLIAAVGLLVVVFGPSEERFLAFVVGAAIAVAGVVDLLWPGPRNRVVRRWRGVAQIVVGCALAAWPDPSASVLGRVVGVWVLFVGLAALTRGTMGRRGNTATPELLWGGALVIGGVILLAAPVTGLGFIIGGVAVAWLIAAGIALSYGLPRVASREPLEVDPSETVRILGLWLGGREMAEADTERLDAKLFYDIGDRRVRLTRFAVLLVLSVVIATLGILTDSTAVVIGAMLVAPLMTPIMGTANGLVSGRPGRAAASATMVAAGALAAIVLAAALSRFLPVFGEIAENSQITARVSPTLLDLLIALAAGAAGAFALSREDVADSLPGVAVAVALVPPLAVVGVCFEVGRMGDAVGALLLFLTNLVAIILAGGFVFLLMGIAPLRRVREHRRRLVTYAVTVLAGVLILSIPLGLTGQRITQSVTDTRAATDAVRGWLSDRPDAAVVSVDVDGDDVEVVVVGEDDPPDGASLADAVEDALDRQVTVGLRWIPEVRRTYD